MILARPTQLPIQLDLFFTRLAPSGSLPDKSHCQMPRAELYFNFLNEYETIHSDYGKEMDFGFAEAGEEIIL